MEKKLKLLKKIKIKNNHPIRVISTENPKINKIKLIHKLKNTKISNHRPISALANQNMNNFAHLFKNNQNANVDILWTLNLRNSDISFDSNNEKFKKNKELINHIKEPSFYQEDLEKYIHKKMKKSKSAFEVNLPSLNQFSYLFKKKISETHGTILNNQELLHFETTLRKTNFKENKNKNNNDKHNDKKEIKKKDWNSIIYKDKYKDLYTVNYNMNTTSEKLKNNWLEEKLVMRPYKVILNKIRYDDKSDLIKKTYIKDKEKAYDKLGENYSFKPYNDKYSEKNYNNIENLLIGNNKTQQNVWFQLGLRNNGNKNISKKYK